METRMRNESRTWYATKSAGDHQGLVINERTGKTIALTYDVSDAPLLAAAPELLAALKVAEYRLTSDGSYNVRDLVAQIQAAISKAEAC